MNGTQEIQVSFDYQEKWQHIIVDNRIAFYRFLQDSDPELPVSIQWGKNGRVDEGCFDGEGTILVFDTRGHYLDEEDVAEGHRLIQEQNAIHLQKYEHGGVHWSIAGSREYPDMQWDVTGFAGVWIPDQDVMDNVGTLEGEALKKRLHEYCQGVLDQYNAYGGGDVWGFAIKVYPVMYDADKELVTRIREYEDELETLDEDECGGGCFGSDSAKDEVQSGIEHYLLGKTMTYPEGKPEGEWVYKELPAVAPVYRLTDEERETMVERLVESDIDTLYNGTEEYKTRAVEHISKLLRKEYEDMTDEQLSKECD